jgi:hypothetical protein
MRDEAMSPARFRFVRIARVDALPRFDLTDRQAKVASQRQLAFKSPPMDEAEKRRLADEIRAQKAREYGVDGLFQ